MLLNNERINNEIAGETVRYFETNEKENVTRNPRDTVKAALRGGVRGSNGLRGAHRTNALTSRRKELGKE